MKKSLDLGKKATVGCIHLEGGGPGELSMSIHCNDSPDTPFCIFFSLEKKTVNLPFWLNKKLLWIPPTNLSPSKNECSTRFPATETRRQDVCCNSKFIYRLSFYYYYFLIVGVNHFFLNFTNKILILANKKNVGLDIAIFARLKIQLISSKS